MALVLLTLVFVVAVSMATARRMSRFAPDLDPAEVWGVSGLVGLGLVGTLALLPGLLPSGLPWGLPALSVLVLAAAVVGGILPSLRLRLPSGWALAALLVVSVTLAFAAIGAIGPSDPRDWDSLAYHLAVPAQWLRAGQIRHIPALHQSNFPFAVDNLYLFGLAWGGEAAAKMFSWALGLSGVVASFGLGRRWAGPGAGWVAAVLFAGMPVVAWEAGTAYVDVAHGLYSALGTLYAAELFLGGSRERAVVAGLCLGLALGTKHTGLAAWGACAMVAAYAIVRWKVGLKAPTTMLGIALLLGLPWYAKSAMMTGNPVFPFFSSVLGGREWDSWRAATYSFEQSTFGPPKNIATLGHSVVGLAYQPGRYVNPAQTEGGGFPTGALGFAVIAAGGVAASLGGLNRVQRGTLALVGVQLLAWFALSQQSRYLVAIGLPLAIVAVSSSRGARRAAAVFAGMQAAYTLWLTWTWNEGKLPVVLGTEPVREYRLRTIGFAAPAEAINALPPGKVALYDEVFGYLLHRPYVWANPGHSTRFGPEGIEGPEGLIARYRAEGVRYVYVNLSSGLDPAFVQRWEAAMHGSAFSPAERDAMRKDPNQWWRVLLAEAVAQGKLEPIQTWATAQGSPRALLFEVPRE